MSAITVGSICPHMRLSDPEHNLDTLTRWSRKAAEAGADLVVPELFITGYAEPFMYTAGYAHRERFLALAETVPKPRPKG